MTSGLWCHLAACFYAFIRQKPNVNFKNLDFFNLLRIVGKKPPRFWICCTLSYFASLTTKIWAGAVGAHPFLAPGSRSPKTMILSILGVKNPEIQKNFFLQISLFLGPIDGINIIFSSGVPVWLHSDS